MAVELRSESLVLFADTRLARLSALTLSFAALMVTRAVIITMRDVTIVQLESCFGADSTNAAQY
jgi:hypothetical protein